MKVVTTRWVKVIKKIKNKKKKYFWFGVTRSFYFLPGLDPASESREPGRVETSGYRIREPE
jgi:hypothetical protein